MRPSKAPFGVRLVAAALAATAIFQIATADQFLIPLSAKPQVTRGGGLFTHSGQPHIPPAAHLPEQERFERVYYDYEDENNQLTGGWIELPMTSERPSITDGTSVTTMVDTGPSSNRIDIVIVGDGYLADELDSFASHASAGVNELLGQQPFLTYKRLFNVHRVDVVSNESGVDHDPTFGIMRDTELGMGFWCNGIERLLCVNVSQAWGYANLAPDADQVFAVANSTKYGGAGYSSSELATYSGGNSAAPEVAIHELGHSLGNLADEYDYDDGTVFSGPEPNAPNASTFEFDEMAAADLKWAAWLGESHPQFDGLVGTYEGAVYSEFGVYRPSFNSKMRSLDRPFNPPSVEALVIEFYRHIDPIDDATPQSAELTGVETLFVEPVQPSGHDLDVRWFLDGELVDAATGSTTLDLGTLDLAAGEHTVHVDVVDGTDFVRDEAARAMYMTGDRSWTFEAEPSVVIGDIDGDGVVGFEDIILLLADWGPCPPSGACPADLDGNGEVDFVDLLVVLGADWS